MKQMEVSFKTEMAKKHSMTGVVTGKKLTKKEKLKIAAKGCKKVELSGSKLKPPLSNGMMILTCQSWRRLWRLKPERMKRS